MRPADFVKVPICQFTYFAGFRMLENGYVGPYQHKRVFAHTVDQALE